MIEAFAALVEAAAAAVAAASNTVHSKPLPYYLEAEHKVVGLEADTAFGIETFAVASAAAAPTSYCTAAAQILHTELLEVEPFVDNYEFALPCSCLQPYYLPHETKIGAIPHSTRLEQSPDLPTLRASST